MKRRNQLIVMFVGEAGLTDLVGADEEREGVVGEEDGGHVRPEVAPVRTQRRVDPPLRRRITPLQYNVLYS
jgi:hypothetical protein